MAFLSRRVFLGRSVMAGVAIPVGLFSGWLSSENATYSARAFGLTPVYDRPGGAAIGSLAPDSVHIVRAMGEWFHTEHGFVPRTAMQPISPYVPPPIESHTTAPSWAELVAPSSAVRAWCDSRAPILATLGYGAVVRVLGTLNDDRGSVWYEMKRGWVVASHFASIEYPSITLRQQRAGSVGQLHLAISLRDHILRLYIANQLLLQSPYYGGVTLAPTLIEAIRPETPGDLSGLPWQMRLGSDVTMRGAWNHNCFGLSGGRADVELPPEVAKAIYYRVSLEKGCTVHIES